MKHSGAGAWLRWTAAGLLLVHAASALAWDTVATVAVDVGTSEFQPALMSEPDANGFWAYGSVSVPLNPFGQVQSALVHYADADHVVAVTPVAEPTVGTLGSSPYAWSLTAMPDGGVLAMLVGSNVDYPQFYGWSCYLQRYDAQGVLRWTTVTYGYSGVGLAILYCPTPDVDHAGSVWTTLDDSTQLTRLAPDGSAAAQIELGSTSFVSEPDRAGGVYVISAGYLARYGADASLQWRVDSAALSMYPRMLVDAGGNVDAIGLTGAVLTMRSYTPAGVLRWTASIPAPANGYIAGATASSDGKIYVSVVGGDTNSSAQLIAIGANGTMAWPAPFVTQTGGDCLGPFAAPVRTAPNGDVLYLYAAASFCDGHTSLFRFRPDGTPVYTFPLGTSGFDYAEAVPGTLADGSTLLAAAGEYTRVSASGAALAPPATAVVAITPTIDAQLALDDGGSYVLASDQGANHHAFARFGADGTRRWQQTGEYFWQSARIVTNGERVCVGGSVTTGSALGDIGITIRCFAATDGAPVWAWSGTGAPISALRLLADGRVVALRAGGHLLIDASGAVVHDIALPALANVAAVDINAAGRAVVATSVTTLNLVAIDSDGSTAYAPPGFGDIVIPIPFALSVSDDGTTVVAYIGRSAAGTGLHALRLNAQGATLWKTFLAAYAGNGDYDFSPIAASIAQSGQAVYVVANDVSPTAAALDRDSGVALWNVAFTPLHPVAPALGFSAFTALLKNPDGPQLLLLSDAGNKVRLTTFDTATGAIGRDRLEACADSPCVSASAVLGSGGALHLASSPITGVGAARPRIYTNVHPFAIPAPIGIGQAGLDGAWFPTYAGGQGFAFDYIAGASTVFMPWFTFTQSGVNDPAGLAWYTLQGGGVTPGTTGAELAIAVPDPGVFNSGAVSGRRVGKARLSFSDCSSGTLWYQFDANTNGGAGGLITLTRLTPSTDPCSLADGTTAPAQNANPPAGGFDSHQSGSWFDPATSGQGMQLTIIPAGNGTAGLVFAAWFTFDPAGQSDDPMNQHWFTLQGDLSTAVDGKVTLPIYRIIGGAFDSTATSNYSAVGQATLTMQACDNAQLDYQFDSTAVAHAFTGLSGSMHLVRIGGCVPH